MPGKVEQPGHTEVPEVLNAPAVAEVRLAQELETKYSHQLSS